MRRPRLLTMAVVSLSLLALPVHASTTPPTWKVYVGNTFILMNGCDDRIGQGGVRFCNIQGMSSVHVRIDDQHTAPISGTWLFYNSTYQNAGSGLFCDETSLAIPPDAIELLVYVGLGAPFNATCLGGVAATEGVVYADWA